MSVGRVTEMKWAGTEEMHRTGERASIMLVAEKQAGLQRYLIRHDYGMGALWWWIKAPSAAVITETFAEVEVIDDPAIIRRAQARSFDELDLADAASGPLTDLYERRQRQRRDPGFGQLLGKSRVYLRLPDPEEPATWWLTEHDPAGRRLRQIEVLPDGTATLASAADWEFNPPFDLGDPQFASYEISPAEFEQAWERAAG
jgi:hypothetical protein